MAKKGRRCGNAAPSSVSMPALFVSEEGRGEVAFGGIRKDGDDGLAGSEAFGKLEGGEDVRAGGDAGEKPFFAGEVACAAKRLFVGDNADVRVDLGVEVIRDETVADAHLEMRADGSAGEDGGVLGFDGPDLNAGVLRLQHFADAAQCSARADA